MAVVTPSRIKPSAVEQKPQPALIVHKANSEDRWRSSSLEFSRGVVQLLAVVSDTGYQFPRLLIADTIFLCQISQLHNFDRRLHGFDRAHQLCFVIGHGTPPVA